MQQIQITAVETAGVSGDELERRQLLIERITACWYTQVLRLAAEMDLPELLHAEPADADVLARQCGCETAALRRLLRALCTLDVCRERSDGRFELAPAGELLRRIPDSGVNGLRAMALWWGGPLWSTWGDLGYSVRTGQSARALHTGRAHYEFMDSGPEMANLFHETMRAMTCLIAVDVAHRRLWHEVRHLVDVGGGHGELAAAMVQAHPHLQATVVDRAHAEAGAVALFSQRQIAGRARFLAGDFFTSLPMGADCYMLKSILHNWDDASCHRILQTCANAAKPGARLLLVERVRSDPLGTRLRDQALARADLNMLTGLGGKERSLLEYAALLQPAGFAITGTAETSHEFSIIEAERR